MKFSVPLTGHAARMRGEDVHGVVFDLGTPEANVNNQYKKKKWLFRRTCKHEFEPLGERVPIMFYQERIAWAYHYVCPKCGETHMIETDSMSRPSVEKHKRDTYDKVMFIALATTATTWVAVVILIISFVFGEEM